MHYTKHFNINGVDTKQVACIELQGKPNAATEGALGVLGIDVTSPTHDVYKCVAVNGSIYTWEFLSSGMSIIAATTTGEGFRNKTFGYSDLLCPDGYVVRCGDLILDSGGYLYRVTALGNTSCDATYTGTQFGVSRDILGVATAVRTINDVELGFFVGTLEEYGTLTDAEKQNLFAIITDDTSKEEFENALAELSKNHEALKGSLTSGSLEVAKAKYATSAGSATNANYATSAGSATSATSAGSATNDGSGNNIASTYAKKSDLTGGSLTVAKATSATSATKATNDGSGNNIVSTYATQNALTSGSLEVALAKTAKKANAVKCHYVTSFKIEETYTDYCIGEIPDSALLIFEFLNTVHGDATTFDLYIGETQESTEKRMLVWFDSTPSGFRFWVNNKKLYIRATGLPQMGEVWLNAFWYIPLDV